jgi:hypothetical protein
LSVNSEDSLGHGPEIRQIDTGAGFYLKSNGELRSFSTYNFAVIALFSCTVILSVTDLITTAIALRSGLQEGNLMLLGVASLFKLNFFTAIADTKLAFISGAALLALIGIKSNIQLTRKIVFSSLVVFVVLLLFVSLNNLLMINL